MIEPNRLRKDATVPQCLDNQYVSEPTFRRLVELEADYTNSEIDQRRARDVKTEFIRSLVYSSQIVVNRAFLINNRYLYSHYDQTSPNYNPAEHLAFARLLADRSIVPFLVTESTLADVTEVDEHSNRVFSTAEDGRLALRSLLDSIDNEVDCLRLSVNPSVNQLELDRMSNSFESYLTGLRRVILRPDLLSELGKELGLDDLNRDETRRQQLTDALRALARFAFDNESFSREDLYAEFLMAGESDSDRRENIIFGRFRDLRSQPCLLELKKLIDLKYNSNLPDFTDSFTFTPTGMPSRQALLDRRRVISRRDERDRIAHLVTALSDAVIEHDFKQLVFDRLQPAMSLPSMTELSVADALEIRGWESWGRFSSAQESVLAAQHPADMIGKLAAFQDRFESLQEQLSEWHAANAGRRSAGQVQRRARVFYNYATIALQVAGTMIMVGAQPAGIDLPNDLGALVQVAGLTGTAEPVRVTAVKLMMNVIDKPTMRIDRARSHSIDLMRANVDMTVNELQEIVAQARRAGGGWVDQTDAAKVADKGSD